MSRNLQTFLLPKQFPIEDSNMDLQKLLRDIADCEARACRLREQLVGNPKLGLDYTGIDYLDTISVKNSLNIGKAALRRLKGLRNALRSLLNHAEYSICKIQDVLHPLVLHNGMNLMLEDTLAMVLEKTVESMPWSNTTLHLAAVNRRFRNVTLSLPKLWTSPPYLRGRKMFKLYLSRSRDMGLSVFLGNTPEWYKEEVLQLTQRWEYVLKEDWTNNNILLRRLSCPRIKAMFVKREYWFELDVFDLKWDVPALRHLSLQNVTPALPPHMLPKLTSLELDSDDSHVYYTGLLRQLSLMHNLQTLSLALRDTMLITNEPSCQCDLRSLKYVSVELRGLICLDGVEKFLANINMASARKVVLKMGGMLKKRDRYASIFSTLHRGRSSQSFPNMEGATYIARPGPLSPYKEYGITHEPMIEVDELLDQPAMRSLYISSPVLRPFDPLPYNNYELNLQLVTLVACNSGARNLLDYLLTHVNPDGTSLCSSIKKLRVLGCPEVTMNYLLEFLPEEKIDWSPFVDNSFQ